MTAVIRHLIAWHSIERLERLHLGGVIADIMMGSRRRMVPFTVVDALGAHGVCREAGDCRAARPILQRAVRENTRSGGGFRLLSSSVTSSLVGLSRWNQPDTLPAGLFPGSAGSPSCLAWLISQLALFARAALGCRKWDEVRRPLLGFVRFDFGPASKET